MYAQPLTGTADYARQHQTVVRKRGPARAQAGCTDCGSSRSLQWSWVHGTDPDDTSSYVVRCATCHNRYDGGRGGKPIKLTAAIAREIRQRYAKREMSMKRLAANYALSVSTVWEIIHERIWREC